MKTMENNNRHQSGGFINGLFVGLVLGFCLALLVSTEKGRKILKALTEEGMDNIEGFKKRIKKVEMDLEKDELDTDYYDTDEVTAEDVPQVQQKPVIHHQAPAKPAAHHATNGTAQKTHPVKRFFKGTKKS